MKKKKKYNYNLNDYDDKNDIIENFKNIFNF